jgi:hypothetical protein
MPKLLHGMRCTCFAVLEPTAYASVAISHIVVRRYSCADTLSTRARLLAVKPSDTAGGSLFLRWMPR